MGWLERVFGKQETTVTGHVTRPIVNAFSETEHERVRQNRYRLDAIKRYIEQNEVIPEARRREFYVETIRRADELYQGGAITRDEHDAFIERVNLAKVEPN